MKKASREKRPMLIPNPKGKLFDQVPEVMLSVNGSVILS
jgi:hypothetical protein